MQKHKVSDTPGAVAYLQLADEFAGNLEILALGPLTNLALASKLDPTFPNKVKRLVIMGACESAQVTQIIYIKIK